MLLYWNGEFIEFILMFANAFSVVEFKSKSVLIGINVFVFWIGETKLKSEFVKSQGKWSSTVDLMGRKTDELFVDSSLMSELSNTEKKVLFFWFSKSFKLTAVRYNYILIRKHINSFL